MNCKNCNNELGSEYKFCNDCGAMVVNERITLKQLISTLLESLGWDNRFLVTLKDLLVKPQFVFEQYLNGTRKKHTNPFAFFAIGTAVSVFVFNFYSEELIELSNNASLKQSETIINTFPIDENNIDNDAKADYLKESQSLNNDLIEFMYQYYYYLSFLLLPVYAFISFLVFRKPNNYAEHLVMNAYMQGLLFFVGLVMFILSLLIKKDVYTTGTVLLTIVYYSYAYKKFYKLSFGRLILKMLRLLGILIVFILLLAVLGFLVGLLKGG